jgi:phospholipid/cholesterol/gamma-HCH transport system permease protein
MSSMHRSLYSTLEFFGGLGLLTKDIFSAALKRPVYFKLIGDQVFHIGLRSLILVAITALSTGLVMALQFGLGLEKFGGKFYVPRVVSMSIIRELGPVFAALMLAARAGAGIASEIGSMKVTEQLDAIRALGASPLKQVVIPRVIACLIVLPLLTMIANYVGIIGGMIVGVTELGLDPLFYVQKIFETISLLDFTAGFHKSFFFSFCISIPSCYFGLNVKDGTRGVGRATTRAVVASCIFIVLFDFLLTKFFWVFEQ